MNTEQVEKTGKEAYAEYLKSDHWKELRQKAIEKSDRCESCGIGENLEVHHLQYRNWTDCTVDDLMTLCHDCHDIFHLDCKARGYDPTDFGRTGTIAFIKVGDEVHSIAQKDWSPIDLEMEVDKFYRKCRESDFDPESVIEAIENLEKMARVICKLNGAMPGYKIFGIAKPK
jgi:protein tyrosine phosphatase